MKGVIESLRKQVKIYLNGAFALSISSPSLEAKIDALAVQQGRIMSALSDLQTAVANLNTSVSNEIGAVTTAIQAAQQGNSGAVAAADAEAIVTKLQGLQKTLDAETATLTGTPAPAPVAP